MDAVVLDPFRKDAPLGMEIPAHARAVGRFVLPVIFVGDASERSARVELKLRVRITDATVEVEVADRDDADQR